MHAIRWTTALAAMLLLAAFPLSAQNKTAPAVTLNTVKYAGLGEAVVQARGKVVVVDLWGFF